jgi:phage gp29-like protein
MSVLTSLRNAVGSLWPKTKTPAAATRADVRPVAAEQVEQIVDRGLSGIQVYATGEARPVSNVPGGGSYPIPHAMTFSGLYNTVSRTYRQPDNALRDSLENARMMRTDCAIMESLEARQRAVGLLKWHIEPEDKDNPNDKARCATLTKLIERIPRFLQYRQSLLEALWYGRSANSQRFDRIRCGGKEYWSVGGWQPINGDKLVFKYGTTREQAIASDAEVGVRVMLGQTREQDGQKLFADRTLEATDRGYAYFLRGEDRSLIALHKHIIEDGNYEDPLSAGRIHGVGIRDRIYWAWYLQKETMATIMEVIERCGTGFTIYYYDRGSEEHRKAVEKIAAENTGNNRLVIPRDPQENLPPIDRIEPSTAGVEALRSIVHEYFGHMIKRYIVGQTMTSEPAGAGLGSTLADVQLGTFMQIVQWDAIGLAETLTTELVNPLRRFNFPREADAYDRFVIEVEGDEVDKKMAGYKSAWEMGLKIPAAIVAETLGIRAPEPGEEVLANQPPSGHGMPPNDGAGSPLDRLDEIVRANTRDATRRGEPFDDESEDLSERAQALADIVSSLFDETTLAQALGDQSPPDERLRYISDAWSSKRLRYAWDPSDHPRGSNGRFIPRGSTEAFSAASNRIRELSTGQRTAESAGEVLSHLNLLTVQQLRELRRTHGVRGSDRTRAAMIERLTKQSGATKKVAVFDIADAPTALGQMRGELPAALQELVGEASDRGMTAVAALTGARGGEVVNVVARNSAAIWMDVSTTAYECRRALYRDQNGDLVILNISFDVAEANQGTGAKVFARQVEAAARAGVARLEAHAAGTGLRYTPFNGYYTWPRLGYDQPIFGPKSLETDDPIAAAAVKERFPQAKTVLDVMKTKEGRTWWKENGVDLRYAQFDLTPGSRSRRVLAAYQAKKSKERRST